LLTKQSSGEKETELENLRELLEPLDIDGVISGALASEYQRTRIEQICHQLNLRSFTPLWHKNQTLILQEQLHAGFQIMITGVFAEGLEKHWLGTILNKYNIEGLIQQTAKYRINPAGEGGEFETLVLDGPLFQKKIVVDASSVEWMRDHGTLRITKAHLESH
jgi:predicted ATP pyrophosphatase (TIGR00289 family)